MWRCVPITPPHIQRVGGLPRHHGDLFDRMLIAQAIEEGLVLVTGDATVQRYPSLGSGDAPLGC